MRLSYVDPVSAEGHDAGVVKPVQSRTALGALVRQMRTQRNLSQKALSEATHGAVSLGMVGLIETGDRNGSADTVDALADALDATDEQRRQLHDARKRTRIMVPPTTADLREMADSPVLDVSDLDPVEKALVAGVIHGLRLARQ